MNKIETTMISDMIDRLEAIQEELEFILEAEEKYMDTVPENLHGSERYERARFMCDKLTKTMNSLSDAVDRLEELNRME